MHTLDLGAAAAEIVVLVAASVLLLVTAWGAPARHVKYGAIAAMSLAATITGATAGDGGLAYYGLYATGKLPALLKLGILFAGAAALAYSGRYLEDWGCIAASTWSWPCSPWPA